MGIGLIIACAPGDVADVTGRSRRRANPTRASFGEIGRATVPVDRANKPSPGSRARPHPRRFERDFALRRVRRLSAALASRHVATLRSSAAT